MLLQFLAQICFSATVGLGRDWFFLFYLHLSIKKEHFSSCDYELYDP